MEEDILDPLAVTNNYLKKLADDNDKKYSGLLLSFSLPKSCYATMLIREITRFSTSVSKQVNWLNEFKNTQKWFLKTYFIN